MATETVLVNAVGAVMGGARRHLTPFLRALAIQRPGWRVVAVGSRPMDSPDGVEWIDVPRLDPMTRLRWENTELVRICRRWPSTVLVNLTNSAPLRPPVPSVLFQRNAVYFDPSWVRRRGRVWRSEAALRRRLAFRQMRSQAAVVAPSHAMASFLRSWPGFPGDTKISVIPHAVDLERFRPRDPVARTPTNAQLRMLSVSHAAPHKGQALLVDLVADLRRGGIDASLDLTVGPEDGSLAEELLERARRAGVGANVHFLGHVADVEVLYGRCDLFVLPSLSEAFGFPLLEAMASGVPVVASGIPASIELLEGCGWLFSPGDASDAARAVRDVVTAPPEEVGARLLRGAQIAREHSWSRTASHVVALVESSGEDSE